MKRITAVILCLVMVIGLCACGGTAKNDEGFLKNLAAALNARWSESEKGNTGNLSTSDYYLKLVSLEKQKLGSFSEYTFTDGKLAELAKAYFDALDKQEEGAKLYDSDSVRYTKLFTTEGYNMRAKAIKQIHDSYGLNINSAHASTLEEMLALGTKVIGIEKLPEQKLVLENTGNEAVTVIENIAGFDIDGLSINVRLIDKDGVVVDTLSDYIDHFAAGAKQRFSVYTRGKEFEKMEMSFSQNATSIQTGFLPVEYVDNMIIELVLPELPAEFSYGYRGRAYTSCIIDEVKYDVRNWNEGTASLDILASGTKTYDRKDTKKALATNSISLVVKIIDDNGTVLGSGTIYVDNLRTGDSFKDDESYINCNLAPGRYYLVIEDNLY